MLEGKKNKFISYYIIKCYEIFTHTSVSSSSMRVCYSQHDVIVIIEHIVLDFILFEPIYSIFQYKDGENIFLKSEGAQMCVLTAHRWSRRELGGS